MSVGYNHQFCAYMIDSLFGALPIDDALSVLMYAQPPQLSLSCHVHIVSLSKGQ